MSFTKEYFTNLAKSAKESWWWRILKTILSITAFCLTVWFLSQQEVEISGWVWILGAGFLALLTIILLVMYRAIRTQKKKSEEETSSTSAPDGAPSEKRSSRKISMPHIGSPARIGLLLLVLVLLVSFALLFDLLPSWEWVTSLSNEISVGANSFPLSPQILLIVGIVLILVFAVCRWVTVRWIVGILVFSLGAYWIDDWHKYNTSPAEYFTYLFSDTWDFPFNTCNGIGLCKYEQYYGEKTTLYTPIGMRLCFERITHDMVVGISIKDSRTGNLSREYRLEEGSDASIEFEGIKKTSVWRIRGLNLKKGGSPLQFKSKYTEAGKSCPRPLR